MDTAKDSLLCPLTLELFRDPVVAQDGHTYEREAIEEWIRKDGTSPLTRQPLSIEHLIPNITVKKIIDAFETSTRNKNYQLILDVDVKKKGGRPLFQTFGKAIYHAEWLPTNHNRPEIILLKVDGARAKKEASFYVKLSVHPHIVRTFGFVGENDNNAHNNNAIMLLQEYASQGSLYEMLVDCKTMPNEKILIEIFLQIIDAMTFLAYNHVVHGDLACRNVLIFRFDEKDPKKIVVKVTDFGLSRHSQLYSMVPGAARTTLNIISTRYAAPEILSADTKPDDYTEKSDVFSMGVLMWEAYCRGTLPWSEIESDKEVGRRVMRGDLLPQPQNCSEPYWSIIIKTWAKSPNDRPTFTELKRLLTQQNYSSESSSPPTYTNPELQQRINEKKSDSVVSLISMNLTNEDMEIVSYYLLRNNTTLTNLHLSYNQIGDKGIEYLSNILQNNTTLTHLYLLNNQIGDKGIEYLSNGLQNNQTLTELWLNNNQIGDKGIEYLSHGLQINKTLTYLNLLNNQIGAKGMEYLSHGLQINKTLTHLYLANNPIGDKGIEYLSNALQNNKTLTELWLNNNQIGDKGIEYLSNGLQNNKTFTSLSLSYNQIGDKGIEYLSHGLQINKTLIYLSLNNNRIGDKGRELLEKVKKNNKNLNIDL